MKNPKKYAYIYIDRPVKNKCPLCMTKHCLSPTSVELIKRDIGGGEITWWNMSTKLWGGTPGSTEIPKWCDKWIYLGLVHSQEYIYIHMYSWEGAFCLKHIN